MFTTLTEKGLQSSNEKSKKRNGDDKEGSENSPEGSQREVEEETL